MNGDQRREEIIKALRASDAPLSGQELAGMFNVSRQVIVQDIALIRARDIDVYSTNRGYVLNDAKEYTRTFKVKHSEEATREELEAIVDCGGHIKDVFVFHKVYGIIRGNLNLRSRRDVRSFMADLESGKSTFLMNTTSGYHYHTVTAEEESILDEIQAELDRLGFLAPLQEYEPVDFI